MKFLKIIILFQFSFIILAEEVAPNTLTIRNSVNESKNYKIKKISKTILDPKVGSVILIETNGDEKCIIPLSRISSIPRAQYQGCVGCIKDDEEVEKQYSELFLNGVEPRITCDVTDDETVAFHFIGATTVNGEASFTSKGMLFDVAVYSNGPFFSEEEEESGIDEVINDTTDILLRIFF